MEESPKQARCRDTDEEKPKVREDRSIDDTQIGEEQGGAGGKDGSAAGREEPYDLEGTLVQPSEAPEGPETRGVEASPGRG